MKTAWFILKFVALTVPLALLWNEWGRGVYGGVLQDVSGTIYGWFGFDELQAHRGRDRYINYIPFLALMILTPALGWRRRLLGTLGGLVAIFCFHMVFGAVPQTRNSAFPLPLPLMQFSDALPFLLWIVLARDFLLGAARDALEPRRSAQPVMASEDPAMASEDATPSETGQGPIRGRSRDGRCGGVE